MRFQLPQLGIVLLIAAAAFAQDTPDARVCTDLSGKIRVTCPGEKPTTSVPSSTVQSDVSANPSPIDVPAGPGHVPLPGPIPSDSGSAPVKRMTAEQAPAYHSLEYSFARNLVFDQKDLWTSPLKLRVEDSRWLLPLVAGSAVVVLSDGSIERKLPTNASFIKQSESFSNYAAAGYAGAVATGYLWSLATHNDHLRETAVLSGEAAINSLLLSEGIKYIAGRQRPFEGDGTGEFRQGGSSFPSLHSAAAWSIASVISREYPGPLTKLLAYGGAAAISAARVTGRQHFTSDALIGTAIGWYTGRQIYNAHHDREDLARYGTFERTSGDRRPGSGPLGSPFVPLGSWVYTAFDRLAALGYVNSDFEGLRPWTRIECARLVEEARTSIGGASDRSSDRQDAVVRELEREFEPELSNTTRQFVFDSVYTRSVNISGKPLTDGYHFGQTVINDYGRPYQQGFNNVTGAVVYATAGPLVFYFNGEYQHAPGAPALPASALAALPFNEVVSRPAAPAMPFAPTDRFRLLDSYVGLAVGNWQLTFGKQSLWWGPTASGPLLFSNNAEPIYMFRINRVSPFRLPSLFGVLGPMRLETIVGRLEGHHFVDANGTFVGNYTNNLGRQPFIVGQKLTFKPTQNLEFGFSRTAMFGGPEFPITAGTVKDVLFSASNVTHGVQNGDQRSGFEFSYRLPGLRNWVTVYNDSFTEDEFSPIAYPRRSAMNPGVYLSHVPGVPKLDFRVEGVYTDLPGLMDRGYYYWHDRYVDGYTNNGNILGSWVGREGRGVYALTSYHFSAESTLRAGFRKQGVNPEFVSGGIIHDYFVNGDLAINRKLRISAGVQREDWTYPVLSNTPKDNLSISVQLTYRPSLRIQ